MERPTGVWVCADTAVAVPLMQHDFLGEVRVEEGLEDLFDLLDIVEADEMELRARGVNHRPDALCGKQHPVLPLMANGPDSASAGSRARAPPSSAPVPS